jgi:outer membrane protein assembly factor BamD
MTKTNLFILFAIVSQLLSGCAIFSKEQEPTRTVEEYFNRGHSALNDSSWDIAVKEFEKLRSVYPYGTWSEQASLELAYVYYRNNEPLSAVRECEEFIRMYPHHARLPYALYLKGIAHESTTRSFLDNYISDPSRRDSEPLRQSYQDYLNLIQRFPNSDYAKDAKLRLVRLRNGLARHEMQVAEFYLDRQAWLAAAKRAQYVLENYPQTPSSQRALQIMAQSYDALGLKQSSDEVNNVMKLNNLTPLPIK